MVGSPRTTTGGGGAPEGAAHAPRHHHHPSPPPSPTVPRATASTMPHPSATQRTSRATPRQVAFFLPPTTDPPLLSSDFPSRLSLLLLPRAITEKKPPNQGSLVHTYPLKPRPFSAATAAAGEIPDRASQSAGMVPRDSVNAALGRSLVHGSVMNQKCEKKVPKKIHKSEREKRKRGTQNDLFNELGSMLEPDRQNSGKACVLGDTTRILKDLVSQVESLRKENITLKNESHYVVLERNELRDDNSMLRGEILELQDKLRMRQQSNPFWSQDRTRSALTISYPTSRVFPVHHSPHLPDITATTLSLQPVVTDQCYAAPPRELQLFPEASSASTEDSELSQDQAFSNSITRPQARYPTPAVMSLPINQFPILPTMGEEQQYISGTSEEHDLHRV